MTLRDQIQQVIDTEPVAIFMKGTPERPACGNSLRALQALWGAGAPITAVDILPDPADPRRSSRALTDWPTIPQVFVKGELIGGADITEELSASGELEPQARRGARAPSASRSSGSSPSTRRRRLSGPATRDAGDNSRLTRLNTAFTGVERYNGGMSAPTDAAPESTPSPERRPARARASVPFAALAAAALLGGGAALAGAAALGAFDDTDASTGPPSSRPGPRRRRRDGERLSVGRDLPAGPAAASCRSRRPAPGGGGLGSGFVIDDEGHIVTNFHVIDGADAIEVSFSNKDTLDATLVGSDPSTDLALLKVDAGAEALTPLVARRLRRGPGRRPRRRDRQPVRARAHRHVGHRQRAAARGDGPERLHHRPGHPDRRARSTRATPVARCSTAAAR